MVFSSLLRKTSFQCVQLIPYSHEQIYVVLCIILSRNSSVKFLSDIPQLYAQLGMVKSYFQGPHFRAMVMKHNWVAAYQTNKNGWSKISPNEVCIKPHKTPVAACINSSSSSE